MKLTAIREQKHDRGRLNIEIDGEYAFSLQAALAARLQPGQEMTDALVEELKSADVIEKAYDRALRFLSYRPRSVQEMRQYLTRRALGPADVEAVLTRLRRARLVDDRAFAEFWVENREAFRPRGGWALRGELRQKGVSTPVIEAAVEGLDEQASALRAAETAARRYRHQEHDEFFRHMLGYLQRRGFPFGVARKATEKCWEEIQSCAGTDQGANAKAR